MPAQGVSVREAGRRALVNRGGSAMMNKWVLAAILAAVALFMYGAVFIKFS